MIKTLKVSSCAAFLVFFISISVSADVNLYAEGAYTETELDVYIYADITAPGVVSYGVKLTYPESELVLVDVLKNNTDWYFGNSEEPLSTPHADPDISTPGEVVVIGGKIDETAPMEGVYGTRILLAVVTFNRMDSSLPYSPDIKLDLGRGGTFVNFVQEDGIVLDSSIIPFPAEIRQRGDVNGDGSINVTDLNSLKMVMFGQLPAKCYTDCNGDGQVNVTDLNCMKNLMF